MSNSTHKVWLWTSWVLALLSVPASARAQDQSTELVRFADAAAARKMDEMIQASDPIWLEEMRTEGVDVGVVFREIAEAFTEFSSYKIVRGRVTLDEHGSERFQTLWEATTKKGEVRFVILESRESAGNLRVCNVRFDVRNIEAFSGENKAAQPAATDNPDGAQRLREDY